MHILTAENLKTDSLLFLRLRLQLFSNAVKKHYIKYNFTKYINGFIII